MEEDQFNFVLPRVHLGWFVDDSTPRSHGQVDSRRPLMVGRDCLGARALRPLAFFPECTSEPGSCEGLNLYPLLFVCCGNNHLARSRHLCLVFVRISKTICSVSALYGCPDGRRCRRATHCNDGPSVDSVREHRFKVVFSNRAVLSKIRAHRECFTPLSCFEDVMRIVS